MGYKISEVNSINGKQEIKDLWHIWSISSIYLSISFAKMYIHLRPIFCQSIYLSVYQYLYIWGRFGLKCTAVWAVWLAQTDHMRK